VGIRRRGALSGTAFIGLLALLVSLGGCAVTAQVASPEPSASAAPAVPLGDLPRPADPRAIEGPSTALLADAAVAPVEDAPSQSLPSTVESQELAGPRTVTVVDTSRVVAIDLAGSIAATAWGLGFGSTLVGRDQSTTFPGAAGLPVVTSGGHTVNAEAIIGLHPTLVITDGTVGPRDVLEQLRDVGITVVFLRNAPSFDGAEELAREVAAVYGAPATGERLAERIRAEVASTEAAIAAIAPTPGLRMIFLYLRGGSGIYYLFGAGSGADVLIDALGGVDAAGAAGWQGMQPLTDEALVAADPELVLVMTDGLASVGGVDGLLDTVPALALTTAGQHRRIVDMADGQLLSFGPRSAAVLDALARAIYAPEPQ